MKETVITVKRKKIEIWTLVVCFVIANVINIYAIKKFDTPWNELFWSLGYVVTTTAVIYFLWSVVRVVIYGIIGLFRKKRG